MRLLNKEISNQKVIIAITILAVFLVGGFFAWQYFKQPAQVAEDETASWQTYRNEEVGFEFRYPGDWKVLEDSFYETASGIKSKARSIIVGKDEVDSNNWIRINPRQFQTSLGICEETANNMVCTYSKNSEILRIFNQMLSTFKFLE